MVCHICMDQLCLYQISIVLSTLLLVLFSTTWLDGLSATILFKPCYVLLIYSKFPTIVMYLCMVDLYSSVPYCGVISIYVFTGLWDHMIIFMDACFRLGHVFHYHIPVLWWYIYVFMWLWDHMIMFMDICFHWGHVYHCHIAVISHQDSGYTSWVCNVYWIAGLHDNVYGCLFSLRPCIPLPHCSY